MVGARGTTGGLDGWIRDGSRLDSWGCRPVMFPGATSPVVDRGTLETKPREAVEVLV